MGLNVISGNIPLATTDEAIRMRYKTSANDENWSPADEQIQQ